MSKDNRKISGSLRKLAGMGALALLALAPPLRAEPTEASAVRPVVIPQTEEVAVRSAKGLDYRIFIYQPSAPPPPSGYPVIYVLDGNAWFEPMAHAVRLQSAQPKFSGIAPAVIVGIGYPGDAPFNQLRRFFDFIPDMPLKEKVPPGYEPPKIGGAAQFLAFIKNELEPMIEKRVKIDRRRRTLFGHSLGCSFALHTLFAEASAFPSYVCASASLHFNGAYLLEQSERFIKDAPRSKLDASLIYAVAEYDGKVPPSVPPELAPRFAAQIAQARVVTGGRALVDRLKEIEGAGLATTFLEIEGENHISEVPVLINRMLPLVLRPKGEQ